MDAILSSFKEADDTLALSPMLVGGVEEEESAFDAESSTVRMLGTESAGEARAIAIADEARGGVVESMPAMGVADMVGCDVVAFCFSFRSCVLGDAKSRSEGELGGN